MFDATGKILARARRDWRASSPPELAPFGRALDPAVVLEAIGAVCREVIDGLDEPVDAIAVTGQRIACAFVDADGETLYLGPNADTRALDGADLDALDPERLYRRTGRFPPWIFAPARARWFAARAPSTFQAIDAVLGLPDWIAMAFTGERLTDATIAADLMMLDVTERRAALEALGLPERAWPAVRPSGTAHGLVHARATARFGLRAGTPVIVGGADTQLALLGAGIVDTGDAVVAGTTAPLCRVTERPVRDPRGRLWTDPHALDDRWVLEANLGEMGTLHAWMRDVFGGSDRGFDAFDRLVGEAPIGARGASAHVGPRAMDLRALNTGRPAALIMPFGETTGTSAPGRGEFFRAYYESCAFAVRSGRAWLDEAAPAGEPPRGAHPLRGDESVGHLRADPRVEHAK